MRHLAAALVAIAGIVTSAYMVLHGGLPNVLFGLVILVVACAMGVGLAGVDKDKKDDE